MRQYTHIILMGMKHTGKSTLGELLAKNLHQAFYDTDTVIAKLSGKTPRELWDSGGAPLMIEWETSACRYLTALREQNGSIIATGGGLADNPEALKILKETGLCIYLDTPFEVLFGRIMASAEKDGRLPPFLTGGDPRELFEKLFTRRTSIYATMADVHIHSLNKTPVAITQEITEYIRYEQRTNIHSRR